MLLEIYAYLILAGFLGNVVVPGVLFVKGLLISVSDEKSANEIIDSLKEMNTRRELVSLERSLFQTMLITFGLLAIPGYALVISMVRIYCIVRYAAPKGIVLAFLYSERLNPFPYYSKPWVIAKIKQIKEIP